MSALEAGITDILSLVKAHVAGDRVASAALADVYESHGDDATAETLRGERLCMRFGDDDFEADGMITLGRHNYGGLLSVSHVMGGNEPVGIIDLYRKSEWGDGGNISLVFNDSRYDEWMVRIVYDEYGRLEVVVNRDMRHECRSHEQGAHGDYDHIFTLPEF